MPIQSTHGQYGSNTPGNCHFCETPGHFQVDCPYKLEMITTGELVHVPGTQNMYRLCVRPESPNKSKQRLYHIRTVTVESHDVRRFWTKS